MFAGFSGHGSFVHNIIPLLKKIYNIEMVLFVLIVVMACQFLFGYNYHFVVSSQSFLFVKQLYAFK